MQGRSALFRFGGLFGLGSAVERISGALLGSEQVTDLQGGFGLAESHRVAIEDHIILAQENDGLAVVVGVESFLEEYLSRRLVVGESLDVGVEEIAPDLGEIGRVQKQASIHVAEVSSGGMGVCGAVDRGLGFHLEFVDHPESVDGAGEVLVRVQRLARAERQCRAGGDDDRAN